jgi:hypothetical protein
MRIYHGVVKGNAIVLPKNVHLADGLSMERQIREGRPAGSVVSLLLPRINPAQKPLGHCEGAAGENDDQNKISPGWDESRVKRVLEHYEAQTDEKAVAEDEAAYEATAHTTTTVPVEVVPAVRKLIAKWGHQAPLRPLKSHGQPPRPCASAGKAWAHPGWSSYTINLRQSERKRSAAPRRRSTPPSIGQ